MKIKTLADLKRDAKSGNLFVEMTIRCGTTNIPEKVRGKRQIVGANSVEISILTNNGKVSRLDIPCASLLEYTDETITIYYPALRDLNEQEIAFLASWDKIENTEDYKNRAERDALTDGSSTFYQRNAFFKNSDFEYLLGYDTIRGKKYDFNTKKVWDNSIKGDISMQYKIVQQ